MSGWNTITSVLVSLVAKPTRSKRAISRSKGKLLERVLDARLSEIDLHDYLHGFRAKRGCGTGIMEAKLLQQLAFREQVPMFGIFLDLRKASNAMDRGRCLAILDEAGVGPCALRLIKIFWDN